MIDNLTTQIREAYLELEKMKNTRQDVQIQLYKIDEKINAMEKTIAKLEHDREFYSLVSLYETFKNFKFPQELQNVVIQRDVFATGRLCCGYTVSDLTFGAWFDLWKNGWLYKGNPVVFSVYTSAGGYVQYWDLSEHKLKTVYSKEKFSYTPEKRSPKKRSLKTVQDIIRFIQAHLSQ